jgi:hypothetical protein
VTEVSDLLDEAAAGFLPPETAGRSLAATLAAFPGMFTAFRVSMTQLAGWAEEFKPGACAAAAITETAQAAAICAEAAQGVSDQFRQDNEFWLKDEQPGVVSHTVIILTDYGNRGFIPGNSDAYPQGYALADILEQLAELFDLIGDMIGSLGDWITDMGEQYGETSGLTGELANHVSVMSVAAETASNAYQRRNSFWLSARGK